jgi:beta-galactosidase
VLDLGQSETVAGFRYTPRQGSESGRIREYRIFIGDKLKPRGTQNP